MISNRRLAHERSETATYVEIQRRRRLNIVNADSNVDQRTVDSDVSKSKLSFIFTISTSSSSSRIARHDDKIITTNDKIIITDDKTITTDDKTITTARKSIERKHASKKVSRIKKRKVIHTASVYFL